MASTTTRPPAAEAPELDSIELLQLEGTGDLPFIALKNCFIQPTHDYARNRTEGKFAIMDFAWPKGICEVADAALRRGYRLLVPCRRDYVATVTAMLVYRLDGEVCVWWNDNHEVLILGLLEENQVQGDEDDGDG